MQYMEKRLNEPITIAGTLVQPGERKDVELPAASLYTQTPINVPINITHGKYKGPRLFVIAAVHGDEINGVEIIRRLIQLKCIKKLHGTLITVPVANLPGFITLSRYLPDRRDLNRAFPGSKKGSLAARLANIFMEEVISKCTHGIDLHTGNVHSENLPHVRINGDTPGSLVMAKAFNTPVILDSRLRDGSIRQACAELKIPLILYEAGEALRFNEIAIRIGLRGILHVMNKIGMIEVEKTSKEKKIKPKVSHYSAWARSPQSGIFHPVRMLGSDMEKGEKLGVISDPFTQKETDIYSPISGIIVGRNTLPLVNEGDALFHIARLHGTEEISNQISDMQHYFQDTPIEFF